MTLWPRGPSSVLGDPQRPLCARWFGRPPVSLSGSSSLLSDGQGGCLFVASPSVPSVPSCIIIITQVGLEPIFPFISILLPYVRVRALVGLPFAWKTLPGFFPMDRSAPSWVCSFLGRLLLGFTPAWGCFLRLARTPAWGRSLAGAASAWSRPSWGPLRLQGRSLRWGRSRQGMLSPMATPRIETAPA